MTVNVQYFSGKECTRHGGRGCFIKFDGAAHYQQVTRDKQYFILNGGVYLSYAEDADLAAKGHYGKEEIMLSPYGSEWTPYYDPWDYDRFIRMKILPETLFIGVKVFLEEHYPGKIAVNSSVLTLENSTVTKTMNANTLMIIVGPEYVVDGVEHTNEKVKVITASDNRELRVSTLKSCSLVYVEPV